MTTYVRGLFDRLTVEGNFVGGLCTYIQIPAGEADRGASRNKWGRKEVLTHDPRSGC